ncbi:MAG: methylated-DNA--[protein]-cysteine S-methyltransferase [Bacteroidales bacterium]|nr:methylated-DNA--[protein]-cysteine S-methyltransferase [Bacteroidales bacterium]MDD4669399.1 methylated-DNA--[protein]-cysteine S-methyltransferase [Bacteroidales bacterium]
MNTIQIQHYDSPAGELILGSFEGKLCMCDWTGEKRRARTDARLQKALEARFDIGGSEVIDRAIRELEEYFSHKRETFDIPLLFVGTDFQKKVWSHLLTIPYGGTISYGEMARQIGMPKAVRALANANGANAISIFAPCHRVIGSDNRLVGYGGGLKAKKILLDLESAK